MAQFAYVEWLFWWLIETGAFEFDWDTGNSSKSQKKHGVSDVLVEECFQDSSKVALGVQFDPPVDEERMGVLAMSTDGLLMVVFTLRNGKVRPISARPANRKEKKVYEAFRKTIERV